MEEHPLAAWLKRQGKTQQDFATEIGRAPSYVSQVISGIIWPSRSAAKKIIEATNGEITADSFLGLTDDESDAA